MYMPPAFRNEDRDSIHATIRAARLANLVTATAEGPQVSPLPLLLDPGEGENGTLYGHLARANPQWRLPVIGEAVAVFMGPDGYVTPSWYETKKETGKVVPTWNYVTVQAHGPAEFFENAERLLGLVTRLTRHHEGERAAPWEVSDAPSDYIAAQLRGIVGLRIPITRLEGKMKMSQNRSEADRRGVAAGLGQSERAEERASARLIPL
jgi:transcriptional regulator